VIYSPKQVAYADLGDRVQLSKLYQIYSNENMRDIDLSAGEFCKMQTAETFTMPNDIAGMFTLRSFAAQAGLEQSTSVWLKPGWTGKLILELKNFQAFPIRLQPGLYIGQVCFFQGDFK
jgi:dCTP deaminase